MILYNNNSKLYKTEIKISIYCKNNWNHRFKRHTHFYIHFEGSSHTITCTPKINIKQISMNSNRLPLHYSLSTLHHNTSWLGQNTVQESILNPILNHHFGRTVHITREQTSPLERKALHTTDSSAPILWISVWKNFTPGSKMRNSCL